MKGASALPDVLVDETGHEEEIGRFAVTMTKNTKLPEGFKALS